MKTDLFVIGGGINGTGIAADAAGRGLQVILCETNDLASATSSWSSKLIHGGLRYLEQYEFKLVREALKEREVLMHRLPHLVHPLSFVLPHDKRLRPKWLIRLGLFLYDHIGGKQSVHKSKRVNLGNSVYGQSLKAHYHTGFCYADCRVDDARLVVLNALLAQDKGATILTRTTCIAAKREQDHWKITCKTQQGEVITVMAKAIVNAAGPWVADVLHNVTETTSKAKVNLVKGSHIIVPNLYDGDHAYILQHDDGRIIFTIPYVFHGQHNNQFTLIGTTDVEYQGDLRDISISETETDYLLEIIADYFQTPLQQQDIVWSYAGVRPLYDDHSENPSKVTREYHFELEDSNGQLPLLSIFGGKITTFRTLAEHALQKIKNYFPGMSTPWTASNIMPGGDITDVVTYAKQLQQQYPFLSDTHAYRLSESYGSRAQLILQSCQIQADLGELFVADLSAKEVDYLVQHEWAQTSEDILWRRSKLGLYASESQIVNLTEYLSGKR